MTEAEICAKITAELKSTNFIGEVHYPPKKIDVDSLSFDNEHINGKRKHDVNAEEAKDFIRNARVSVTKSIKGVNYENYFGDNGSAYVDTVNNKICTAFTKNEYNPYVNGILKIVDKYEK